MHAPAALPFQSIGAAQSECAAYQFIEALVWPRDPICPHCGTTGRSRQMQGLTTRIGTYKCYQCRKPFTVKLSTAFKDSHVRLHVWLRAIYLFSCSRRPMTAYQLSGLLGVSLKTAQAMIRRMRAAGINPSAATTANASQRAIIRNGSIAKLSLVIPGSSDCKNGGNSSGAVNEAITTQRHNKKPTDLEFERFVAVTQQLCTDQAEKLFTAALARMIWPSTGRTVSSRPVAASEMAPGVSTR